MPRILMLALALLCSTAWLQAQQTRWARSPNHRLDFRFDVRFEFGEFEQRNVTGSFPAGAHCGQGETYIRKLQEHEQMTS